MIAIDQKFPDYSLEAYFPGRDDTGRITSRDLAGKWALLFWYPADFTFVCPTELADLNAHHQEFKTLGAEIVSISTDTVYTHKAWLEAEKLISDITYPMAADHNGVLARAVGMYDESSGMAQRAAFIIDPDGILRAIDIVSDAIGRSAGELLRKLKALKFVRENPGRVCPASWDEGAPTIRKSIKIAGKIYREVEKK